MHIGLYVKYPLFLSDFNDTWILSTDFRKIPKYQIKLKSVQWESISSVWSGRYTDRHGTKLLLAFRNFANLPNKKRLIIEMVNIEIPHSFYSRLFPALYFKLNYHIISFSSALTRTLVSCPFNERYVWREANSVSSRYILRMMFLVCK
jgi:hypothetical protein